MTADDIARHRLEARLEEAQRLDGSCETISQLAKRAAQHAEQVWETAYDQWSSARSNVQYLRYQLRLIDDPGAPTPPFINRQRTRRMLVSAVSDLEARLALAQRDLAEWHKVGQALNCDNAPAALGEAREVEAIANVAFKIHNTNVLEEHGRTDFRQLGDELTTLIAAWIGDEP